MKMKAWVKLTISILGLAVLPFMQSHNLQAATLTGSPNIEINDLNRDFQAIAQAFNISSDLLLSSVSSEDLPINSSNESLQVILMVEKLSQLENNNSLLGNFADTLNALTKVEWISVLEKLASAPMVSPSNGFSANNDINSEENPSSSIKPVQSVTAQLTKNYLSFVGDGTNSIDNVTLPGNNYNTRRPELLLIGAQRSNLLELMSGNRNVDRNGQIVEPKVDEGIRLDRPNLIVDKFESALQLWLRNVFASEVKGYGSQSEKISETLAQFGPSQVTVNYKTMPKEILKTSLDLEVNWVDRGQYSENLRQTNLAILEIYRERNEKYQQILEERRQQWVNSKKAYQQKISERTSRQFDALQRQRSVPRTNYNNLGRTSSSPARYR